MNETGPALKLPPFFRIWDPVRQGFGFADQRPKDGSSIDAWTGRFDKEGYPIYEHDIISVHHDWKLGWVRALVEKQPRSTEFVGKVTGPDGAFHIGAFQFADAYIEGNVHQHPYHLIPAMAQFPDPAQFIQSRLWSDKIFRTFPGTNWN